MPSKSRKQRRVMAIARYAPEKLYKRDKALTKMTKKQLGEYASTPEKKLPVKVREKRGK